MANSKFYLKEINNTKKTPIRLHFHYDNKVFKYPTKLSIEPHKWCDKTHRVKKQVTHCIELNRQIQNIEDNIIDIFQNMKLNGHTVSNPILKQRLNIKLNRVDREDFFEYIDLYIYQKKELKASTKQDYKQTQRTIRQFEASTGYLVSFETINLNFYNRFKDYMLNGLNHSINTFGKRIKMIKSIMNYATEMGINKNLEYQKKSFKVLSEKVSRIYLSTDEVNILYHLELNETLSKTRDVFVLMCYLGIRFSDYKRITKNNIHNEYLDIVMEKTNEPVSIPLHPHALEIIKRWNYNLPSISNPKLNKNIKKICKQAHIDEIIKGTPKYKLVTCHTARRSFATNGYLSDVLVRDLMRITGHKKETTFLNYVQVKREITMSKIMDIYPIELKKVV
jgi:integrase